MKTYAEFSSMEDVKLLHENGMLLIALLASLPFWLRVRQCWVQFDGCSDPVARIPIALNTIKYMTAFPPIWITAAASLGYYHRTLPTIIALAATVNSLYSYLWDIIMDWGLVSISFRDCRMSTRQRMLLPWPSYLFAAVVNLVLRFSWAMNRLPWLRQLDMTVIVLSIGCIPQLFLLLLLFSTSNWLPLTHLWQRLEKSVGGRCGTSSASSGKSSCSKSGRERRS